MTPSPWTAAYLGLPYVLGEGECAQFAARVWRERFGRQVDVAPAHGDMLRAQRLIRAHMEGPHWQRVEVPEEGDAVVMRKGSVICHVGIWVEPGHVLHCTRADGTTLTALDDLPEQGFHVVGYFRTVELRLAA
jgi:cell wall-associated NlpC family hydrolase